MYLVFYTIQVKYNQIGPLFGTMSVYDACTALTGISDKNIKTNAELAQIATEKKNSYLLFHVRLNQMYAHIYNREYIPVLELAEHYQGQEAKRVGDVLYAFFVGIAALSVARDITRQNQWRQLGERQAIVMDQLVKMRELVKRQVITMDHHVKHSTWNFLNKVRLLRLRGWFLVL